MTVQSKTAARPSSVTTGPIAGSRKIHVSPEGRPDILVPFREIALDPTAREAPFHTYDTSGPYTDPERHYRPVCRPAAGAPRVDRRRGFDRIAPARLSRRTTAASAATSWCRNVRPSTSFTAASPASPSPNSNSPAPASSPRR